jgi:regulator of RNase E activity RraA
MACPRLSSPILDITLPMICVGVQVKPGDWVYADKDGIVVSPRELTL